MFATKYTINLTTRRWTERMKSMKATTHGSDDGRFSVCGIDFENPRWNTWQGIITSNNYDGEITCKKCIKVLREELNKNYA